MSFEPVDFYVKDSTPQASPVEGVLIRIFSEDGSIFYTQATTDVDGKASFLLETLVYSARFYKFQVGFNQPQVFEVLAAPETNVFDASAEVFSQPMSTDPRYCRASGFFRSVTGAPHVGAVMQFVPSFDPLILDAAGIIDTKDSIRTDGDGYVQIDLVRGAVYRVFLQGLEECPRKIRVPDRSSINLPDLLYPVVQSVVLDPEGPLTLTTGSELEVVPIVTGTDGVPLEGTGYRDVLWKVSDSTIAAIQVSKDKLTIRGLSVGATTLTAERKDTSIVRIPDTGISGQPVSITVT